MLGESRFQMDGQVGWGRLEESPRAERSGGGQGDHAIEAPRATAASAGRFGKREKNVGRDPNAAFPG